MLINILCHRDPLVWVNEFYEHQDMELLFNGEVTADQLNDDALGQCLEKLAETDQHNLIAQVGLSALSLHDLDITHLHEDTTSISVQGEFANLPYKDFAILRGHSKDKRPDLKQFMLGFAVQQDGLPAWGEALKGNTSDKQWNPLTVSKQGSSLFGSCLPEKPAKNQGFSECFHPGGYGGYLPAVPCQESTPKYLASMEEQS